MIEESPCEVVTTCENAPEQDPPKAGQEPPASMKPDGPPPAPPAPPSCAPPASSEPWNETLAFACAPDDAWPACPKDGSQVCLPAAANFAACVRKAGDEACPDGWPMRHVVYDNVEVERSCSPCSCGAPAGGNCIVEAAVTSGNACSGMYWNLNVTSAEPPGCVDLLPSGSSLGGKTAAVLVYEPGMCEPSGGEPFVTITRDAPTTFCCRSAP
ncbi:hypothetical protein [Polyangium aurulentum]|uniref:hypothetical protein n=1 Tax=Polyangium aurulentum TaxID=2567896 RepID=UPI00113F1849|nr:hypothetical protein [Polyangium aurulentum]UQA57059.1 hypothetical protein E8A73_038080 [Polyangium aurulentum]